MRLEMVRFRMDLFSELGHLRSNEFGVKIIMLQVVWEKTGDVLVKTESTFSRFVNDQSRQNETIVTGMESIEYFRPKWWKFKLVNSGKSD